MPATIHRAIISITHFPSRINSIITPTVLRSCCSLAVMVAKTISRQPGYHPILAVT